ncbi:MAG: glycosyltransferase [Patescibacteria group bacterium]
MQLVASIKQQLKADQYLHVIVNDGSTDNTTEILKQYAARDANIVLINQKHHDGTYAFNLGIDVSIGPEAHEYLLGENNFRKIVKLNAQFIMFIGTDDLVGPGLANRLEACRLSSDYKLFLGDYRSFIGDEPYSRKEFTPYASNPESLFKKLFYVENFPSHTIIWKKDFLQELKKLRGYDMGIIDPQILSPQAWDLMLYTTKLAIIRNYRFGFIKGNTGYKRYGISGTMTEKNRKAGRYLKERELVFHRYKDFAADNKVVMLDKRPPLNHKYFKPLKKEDKKEFDSYLSKVFIYTSKLAQNYL